MLYYSKITARSDRDAVYINFINYGGTEENIVLDISTSQKKEESVYQRIKTELLEKREGIVIDSLASLGKNNREIAKELQWFADNNIQLKVLNIPSTMVEKASPTQILAEAYQHLAEIEIRNVKKSQLAGIQKAQDEKRTLGRKKIPYPKNWEENYKLWKMEKITAVEFMQAVGLKKGTFYNLLKQYNQKQVVMAKEA